VVFKHKILQQNKMVYETMQYALCSLIHCHTVQP